MTGKTLKELNVQVGDVVGHSNAPGQGVTFKEHLTAGEFSDEQGNTWNGNVPGWSIISRATPEPLIDLSTMSREQLKELGQRVTNQIKSLPKAIIIPAHRLDMPIGTYTHPDGHEISVEEV